MVETLENSHQPEFFSSKDVSMILVTPEGEFQNCIIDFDDGDSCLSFSDQENAFPKFQKDDKNMENICSNEGKIES